jgi:ERCC4-type nuclease
MPAKNLKAHLDHIAFRDGIHMIYTLDEENTAERLFELAINLTTIKPSLLDKIDKLVADEQLNITGGDLTPKVKESDLLTTKQESRISIQEQLLQCLPSIGSIAATVLAEKDITLLDIYNGYEPTNLARFKYPTGNSIGLAKATKICECTKYFTSKSIASTKIQIRILSNIPQISKKTADSILKTVTLADIMSGIIKVETLKNITRGKTKLGQKAATNILHYLIGYVDEDIPLVKKKVPLVKKKVPTKKVPTKKVPTLDIPDIFSELLDDELPDDDLITIENPILPPKKSKKAERPPLKKIMLPPKEH